MIKNVLQAINGVEIYPIISLILFLLSFTAVLIWTIRMKKSDVLRYSKLPLEDDIESKKNAEITDSPFPGEDK